MPQLIDALQDEYLYVRIFAAGALGSIGPKARSARDALKAAADDPTLRDEAAWALSRIGGANVGPPIESRAVPPPSVVGRTLWELAASGELLTHAWATLCRVGAGFGLGALAGTLIGAVTGALPFARSLLDPTLQALRAIPSIAWVPLFILWLGIFEASKVALIAVGVFFPVYLGVAAAIQGIDR